MMNILSTFHPAIVIARPSGLWLTRKSIPRSADWGTPGPTGLCSPIGRGRPAEGWTPRAVPADAPGWGRSAGRCARSSGRHGLRDLAHLPHVALDPPVGLGHPVGDADARCPAQDLLGLGVVA